MKKVTVLIITMILILSFATMSYAESRSNLSSDSPFVFKDKIFFGMNRDDVISIEGEPVDRFYQEYGCFVENKYELEYDATVSGLSSDLTYHFNEYGELYNIKYTLPYDNMMSCYYRIERALIEKYGEAVTKKAIWADESAGHSNDAYSEELILSGDLVIGSIIEKDEVQISHSLFCENGYVFHLLEYYSSKYDTNSADYNPSNSHTITDGIQSVLFAKFKIPAPAFWFGASFCFLAAPIRSIMPSFTFCVCATACASLSKSSSFSNIVLTFCCKEFSVSKIFCIDQNMVVYITST